jgi:hypothetical protein
MDNHNLIGTAIVYNDAYDGIEKYAKLIGVSGNDGIWRSVSKEEAGTNPRRVIAKPDTRIDGVTGGTGTIE